MAQGAFVRLYTAAFGSMCGSDLRVNVTYLIQGTSCFVGNRAMQPEPVVIRHPP